MAPASIAIMSAGCTAAALLMLPRDVLLTYRAAYATALIGPNVKALVMLLLPIALALWPCVVLVGSTIVALVWPTLVATAATFDDEENLLLGGWLTRSSWCGDTTFTLFPTIKDALRFTRDFWDFNQYSLFAYIEDVRQARRDGGPFDISVCALLLGVCQASVCALLLLVVGSCLAALKLVPIVLGLYVRGGVMLARHLAKNACGFKGLDVFFLTWVVGLTGTCIAAMLIPLVVALALALGVLACGFAGIHCAVVAYRHGSLRAGFLQMVNLCHHADEWTTHVMSQLWCESDTDNHACCFPRCFPRCFPHFDLGQRMHSHGQRGFHISRTDAAVADPPAAPASPVPAMPLLTAAGGVIPMSAVFDSFFEQCKLVMADGLSRSVLTRAAVLDLEPAIFLGVPACVLLHTAYRSAATPEGTLTMADGTVVTDATRPRNSITQLLYEPLLALTRSLRHASLSQAQFTQLCDAALAQDASFASFKSNPPVHALLAESLRLAIHVSRLPMFRRRFGGALEAVLRKEVESHVEVTVVGIG